MNIELHTQTMNTLMEYCKKYRERPHRVCNELLDTYMDEFIEYKIKLKTNTGDNNENNKQY